MDGDLNMEEGTDGAAISRKKKVRAAHRGSATRIMGQTYENLGSGEGPNLSRLRQQKVSLTEKLELLSKLDDELIEVVTEEELEAEVEQADIVREKIRVCVNDIDQALEHRSKGRAPGRDGTRSLITRSEDGHSEDETGRDPPTDHRTSPPRDTSGTDPPGTVPGSEGESDTVRSGGVTGGAGGLARDGSGTDVRSPGVPQVKLPKLTIKRFAGDLTKWAAFWDSFESAIHQNPSLSAVDKFNYLKSFLESTAAESIAGLTLTSANYDEAIATLKARFGNTQLIVNKHMDALLHLSSVMSHHDLKGLRRLYDSVETHVRGLRALGVPAESYGTLLISILMNKLPPEIRLVASRELTGEVWGMEEVMKIVNREVTARERSSSSAVMGYQTKVHSRRPFPPAAAALVAGSQDSATCVYCDRRHFPGSCTVVTTISARKEVLRRSGRCYVCLRKHHLSRDCRSSSSCSQCRGRHHLSICPRTSSDAGDDAPVSRNPPPRSRGDSEGAPGDRRTSTNNLYTDAQTPVLLQTAMMELHNPEVASGRVTVRGVLDSGSQRTYITDRVSEALNLSAIRSESLLVKTFGSPQGLEMSCEVVELGLRVRDGSLLTLSAVVVPFICNPLSSQPISDSGEHYPHLAGLDLADSATGGDLLEIDALVGSDFYWSLVTGEVRRGTRGPMAIHTKIGWVLSGPVDKQMTSVNLVLGAPTHTLKVEAHTCEESLDDQLRRFWDLESLGIVPNESSVYEKFTQEISFDGQRYEVSLPWKETHSPLPDNHDLSHRRLLSLLKRLQQDPKLLSEYDSIIKDQVDKGVVEPVPEVLPRDSDRVHYLPHHAVVRRDKATSKLRIVYDASARSNGPALNDCLYTGPNFGQSIFDILLRFRLHKVALAGDIEKAFLMVSVAARDRDCLRFLWVRDVSDDKPEVVEFRFARVVFGVKSSPFLLNATINHHMKMYELTDPTFVEKFLSSIYVDDVSLGADNVDSTYELYLKAKVRLAEAGFKLRKFVTNSEELRARIAANELPTEQASPTGGVSEEDQSYAKESLGVLSDGGQKILGVMWDFARDQFSFNVGDVYRYMEQCEPTKRNVVSMAARFFDPLGVVSPVTISFKIFFQHLCEAKVAWDEPLTECLLQEWNRLCSTLRDAEPLTIPRCYLHEITDTLTMAQLVGFCDASTRAYAAVLYLRMETESSVFVRFLAAKTRVAPLTSLTIPRLELLSALLLSKLLVSVRDAFGAELTLHDPVCYSDSKVALYWIRGCHQEWKQFVQNRVNSIRTAIPPQQWEHCPGRENPADLPSRGVSVKDLLQNPLWLSGPEWLHSRGGLPATSDADVTPPQECWQEVRASLKTEKSAHTLLTTTGGGSRIGNLIDCKKFSSFRRLLNVTSLVFKFIRTVRSRLQNTSEAVVADPGDDERSKIHWLRDVQLRLEGHEKFPVWSRQLDLYLDGSQLWRCGGRMRHSDLPLDARNPILLDKRHPITSLIVLDCHRRVMHNGVRETLAELRSTYWLVRGRQFVRQIVYHCIVCRRLEGKPYRSVPSPDLPEWRVTRSRPFEHSGVDFAGPLFIRDPLKPKVWLCLYTCCTTRAVHLELVPDLNTATFIRCFKRFSSRRGMPSKMISDNGKTFKSASKVIERVLSDSVVQKYFSDLRVQWIFNLEKAPWWGGMFERLIKSAKRCLRKVIGRCSLTYEELATVVTEVEAVLNSRPLTYVDSDDLVEPLTPSHLMLGFRVLSLPDPIIPEDDDPDYNESASDLTKRMRYLATLSEGFWKRWRAEYLTELREFHRHQKTTRGVRDDVTEGKIVTVYEEGTPRGLWRLGRIERVIVSPDGKVRSAVVRVRSKTGRYTMLKRPIQHLYPLEVGSPRDVSPVDQSETDGIESSGRNPSLAELNHDCDDPGSDSKSQSTSTRSRRKAAVEARDRIIGWLTD